MGFNPEHNFLNKFLIDACEILVLSTDSVDEITGIENNAYVNETNTGSDITLIPCRKEPAVSHNRDTDKKSARNKQDIFATHNIWFRDDIVISEFGNVIFNINGDNKYYDILFIETYPDMIGRNTQEVIVAERRNNG